MKLISYGAKINIIAKGLKVSGCGSLSQIFQDDKKENIEIIVERVLHIPGYPIWIIFPQQVAKQTEHIGDFLHVERDEAHLIFGGLKFTTKYNANSGRPIYNSVNIFSTFKAYNTELHRDGKKTDNLTLAEHPLLKWNILLGHTNFLYIIRFMRLGLIPFI